MHGPEGEAYWRDGTSTAQVKVQAKRIKDLVMITFADGRIIHHRLREARLSPRMQGVPLRIEFADHTSLEVPYGPVALALYRGGASGVIGLVESNFFKFLLPLLLGVAVALWVLVSYVVPLVAVQVARLVPVTAINAIGDQYYQLMRRELDLVDAAAGHAHHHELLDDLGWQAVAETGADPDFNFRFLLDSGKVWGANAFALPNGHIVFTTEILDLLTRDEAHAVMTHEIAHVELRHGVRTLVRNGVWYVLGAFLLNDYSLMVIPAMVLNLGYTRDEEAEADCFAARSLVENGYDPELLVTSLAKLEAHAEASGDEDEVAAEIERLRRERNQDTDADGHDHDVTLSAEDQEAADRLSLHLRELLSTHPLGEHRMALIRECVANLEL